jgi:hypothetical protein
MLQGFFRDSALGVAGFVPVISVAGATAGKHVDNSPALAQIIETQIKEPCALPIYYGHAQIWLRA